MEKKIERTMSWEMYFNQQKVIKTTKSGKDKEDMLSASQNVVEYNQTMRLVRGTMLSLGIDIANGFVGKGDVSNKSICRAFAGIAREMGLGEIAFASYHANFFRSRIVNAKQFGKVTVRGNQYIVKVILDVIGMAYRGEKIEVISKVNQSKKSK
jgi:hypothetical protein